jgi:hypothetical protein
VLPPACPTRRPQRISDVQASACCRLSLLLAALVAAATPLVAGLPDAVLGRFVLPRAIRLRLAAAHGRRTHVRLRLMTGDRRARVRLWRRAADGRDTPIGLRGLIAGGRRAHARLRLVARDRAVRIPGRRLTTSGSRASFRLRRLVDCSLRAHVRSSRGAGAVRGGRSVAAAKGELAISNLPGLNRWPGLNR